MFTPTSVQHSSTMWIKLTDHDDVIQWKHFPRYWSFVGRIYRSPVNSPHNGQWRGTLMFIFYLRPNKRLCKQWWGCWFETPSSPLWRHCNVLRKNKAKQSMNHVRKSLAISSLFVNWCHCHIDCAICHNGYVTLFLISDYRNIIFTSLHTSIMPKSSYQISNFQHMYKLLTCILL